MNKENHVRVCSVPHNRRYLDYAAEIERKLERAVGRENVDWWVDVLDEAQCSYFRFTVPKELKEKAENALK